MQSIPDKKLLPNEKKLSLPGKKSLLPKTGELFLKHGFIDQCDIDNVLSIQKKGGGSAKNYTNYTIDAQHRFFGIILCNLNLITPIDNYYILHKYNKLFSLKDFLISKTEATKKKVLHADKVSKDSDTPLITTIVNLGVVPVTDLQKTLFNLYHIPYRSIKNFLFNENIKKELQFIIKKDSAEKNRIIPIVIRDGTLLVGITDPENLLFLRELSIKFPHYRFKALFIPFKDFINLFKLLYNRHGRSMVTASAQKSPDISLLLNFKISIIDPAKELDAVSSMYKRYEMLRELTNHKEQDNRLNDFNDFIIEKHKEIAEKYGCRTIDFSLKNKNNNIIITAIPKK